MLKLLERSRERHLGVPSLTATDYVNTHPGRGRAVVSRRQGSRASVPAPPALELGGHGAPRSASWRRRRRPYLHVRVLGDALRSGHEPLLPRKDHPGGGDQVFFQGHASPGMYARAFLRAACKKPTWTASARRRATSSTARSARCPATRTRVRCRTSGSSPPCRWASAPSTRSGRPFGQRRDSAEKQKQGTGVAWNPRKITMENMRTAARVAIGPRQSAGITEACRPRQAATDLGGRSGCAPCVTFEVLKAQTDRH